MPCSARNAINSPIDCAPPHSAEPSRKIEIETTNSRRRPYRSESFPYSGTVTVVVSRYAVTTQLRLPNPFRSSAIVGNAVATIV